MENLQKSKSYHRAERDDDSSQAPGKKGDIVQNEVSKLLKSGKSSMSLTDLVKLREKYNDARLVDEIYDAFADEQREISKYAKKFAKLIMKKYGHLPFHKILHKAVKYKKKLNLSDAAFTEFKRIYEQTLVGTATEELVAYRTRIGKALGYAAIATSEGLNISDNEFKDLQKILEIEAATRILHHQVMLQAMTYRDLAPEALVGKYNRDKHNPASHIHPVVAALFLPKIKILDEHMLYANIGRIIRLKHEKKQILTKPDWILYHDLVSDPNDIVCNIESAMADLKNRVELQHRLWESVLRLRNGQYYDDRASVDFMLAIDKCRVNIYDTPDLMYLKDDGAVLRRLLSAFSFRPTFVSTSPLYGIVSSNPFDRSAVLTKVTPISMVTLKLPLNIVGRDEVVRLEDSLEQPHLFLENKTIVPKSQTIIYSSGVLFFYVNRRYQQVNISKFIQPYSFAALPMTIAGFEQLNTRDVDFDDTMQLGNEYYKLRSVVVVEQSQSQANLITGSTAMLMKHRDFASGQYENVFLLYDPMGAGQMFLEGGSYVDNKPITFIPGEDMLGASGVESFKSRARSRGQIFCYEREELVGDQFRNTWMR